LILSNNKNKTLQEAFNFSAEELELNSAGQLSPSQEERLESHRSVRGCGRRAALIGFGTASAILFLLPFLFANEPGIDQARPYIWGVAGLFLALVLGFGVLDFFAGQDLTQGKISVLEGAVYTKFEEIGTRKSIIGTAYYLTVGLKQYQLASEAQMEALNTGEIYRFFYVPNGRVPIILSVEPLD